MSFVIVFRNENGQYEYFDKAFSSEAEAYEFTRVHRITEYTILSEEEFQAWQQSLQQQRSGPGQNVTAISDERTGEYSQYPKYQMGYKTQSRGLFRPYWVHPTFVGKRRR